MTKQQTRIAPAFPSARVPRLMWLTAGRLQPNRRSPAGSRGDLESPLSPDPAGISRHPEIGALE